MRLVRDLEEIDRDCLSEVGSKGANAGELKGLGFPVPDGFCISARGHESFITENGLLESVEAFLERGADERPSSREERRRRLAGRFESAPYPPRLEEEILAAWRRHFTSGRAAAVRSSCIAEDLAEASFAGQYGTILNVRSEAALLLAVKWTWASLLNTGALQYGRARRVDEKRMRMAVLVQAMIPGDVSGILFTVNPVSLRDNELVIDASWGLGPPIVAGAVTPDHFVLDKITGRVLDQQIAAKATRVVLGKGDGEETVVEAVSESLIHAPALTEPQAARLCTLGIEIERHYGAPQDIEWSYHGDTFYVLQSRPITTL